MHGCPYLHNRRNPCPGSKFCQHFHEDDKNHALDCLDCLVRHFFQFERLKDSQYEAYITRKGDYESEKKGEYFGTLRAEERIQFALSYYEKYKAKYRAYQIEMKKFVNDEM